MIKFYFTILCYCCITASVLSQEDPYMIRFSDIQDEDAFSVNRIKYNIFGVTRGDHSLYFEHVFKNKVAFELGAGITLRDWYREVLLDNYYFFNPSVDAEVIPGFSLSGEMKYYFSDHADRFYLAAGLTYRKHFYTVSEFLVNVTEKERFEYLFISPKLAIGWLQKAGPVVFDFYFALGPQIIEEDEFLYNEESESFKDTRFRYQVFYPQAGIRFGLGFTNK
jgi:hypothetical protein